MNHVASGIAEVNGKFYKNGVELAARPQGKVRGAMYDALLRAGNNSATQMALCAMTRLSGKQVSNGIFNGLKDGTFFRSHGRIAISPASSVPPKEPRAARPERVKNLELARKVRAENIAARCDLITKVATKTGWDEKEVVEKALRYVLIKFHKRVNRAPIVVEAPKKPLWRKLLGM